MSHAVALNLQQRQTQSLKQMQYLMMSHQMQQSIHLLQLPILELASLIDQEIEQNPLIERSEDEAMIDSECNENENEMESNDGGDESELLFDDRDFNVMKQLDEDFRGSVFEGDFHSRSQEEEKLKTFQESSICAESTLFDHLMMQAREYFGDSQRLRMAEEIIGNFDRSGYLQTSLSEIALVNEFEEQLLEAVLKEIQTFDPYGVGASGLQESLLIQMRCLGKQQTLAYEIIEKNYDDLLHNHIRSIQKNLGCTIEEIEEAVHHKIARLELHPGMQYSRQIVQPIVPDAIVNEEDSGLVVTINEDFVPPLRLNSRYMRMMEDPSLSIETKEFIRNKIISAKWLVRNVYQRRETLEKICKALCASQKEFFTNVEGQLLPMTMKTLAEELNLHESTIARAVMNKYLYSPRGMMPLRAFFTNAYTTDVGKDISAGTVREMIQELIQKENKKHPLSDSEISEQIAARGVCCARRTVAKYRVELDLGNAHGRRKYS